MRTPLSRGGARSFAARLALVVLGGTISTVCYAVTIRARLGLGPLYAVQDGIARHAGITIGTSVMLTGVGLIAIACVLRAWPGVGTLGLPFLGGFTLDALLPHLPVIHGLATRVVAVVLASWVMALGGALVITAALGASALDMVMLGFHRVLGGRTGGRDGPSLRRIRLVMEATMLVTGALLGGSIGAGTVITGALIGPSLQFWIAVTGRNRARRLSRSAAGSRRPTPSLAGAVLPD